MSSPEDLRRQAMKEEILKDIKKHPGTWVEDISRRLGWNRQTVGNYVRMLESDKSIYTMKKGAMIEIWPTDGK
jgi:predicted transcriptional regulator